MLVFIFLIGSLPFLQTTDSSHHIAKKQFINYDEGDPGVSNSLQTGDDGNNGEAFGEMNNGEAGGGEMNSFTSNNNDVVSSFINNEDANNKGGEGDMGGNGFELEGGNQNLLEDNGASRHMLETPDSTALGGQGENDMTSLTSLFNQESQQQGQQTNDDGLSQASQTNDGLDSFSPSSESNTNQSPLISSFTDTINAGGGGGGGGNGEDMLSSLTDDPFGKKFESSVNLGDSLSTSSSSPNPNPDFASLENYKGNSVIDKLLTDGYSLGLPSNGAAKAAATTSTGQAINPEQSKHNAGEAKEGIGSKFDDVQDLLSKELGQLDTADEKLEKMLENGIDSDSSAFSNSDGTGSNDGGGGGGYMMSPGPTGGPMHAGAATSQWGGTDATSLANMQTQMTNQYPDSPSIENLSDDLSSQQQQHMMKQNSGPSQPSLNHIQHTVVHQHASDSQHGAKAGNDHLSLAASNNAASVAMKQKASHQLRLQKLKQRLSLLNKKIEELTDEQSKKSSDPGDNSPRKVRNNAIKRLLIKNLKLAALIASKEIQLEETKARSLSNSSERKEDSLKASDPVNEDNFKDHDFLNVSKPLTELSRKAEEEVNHLTKNNEQTSHELAKAGHHDNSTITTQNATLASPTNKTLPSTGSLKINETLAILDMSGSKSVRNDTIANVTSSLTNATANAADLTTFSPTNATNVANVTTSAVETPSGDKPIVVGEKGIATLFTAMKQKAATSAKRRSSLHKRTKKYSVMKVVRKNSMKLSAWD